MKSYLEGCSFVMCQNCSFSFQFPQGNDLSPFLYIIFIHDFPKTNFTSLGTYVDDTLIIARRDIDKNKVSQKIQTHLYMVDPWPTLKIKINESKSFSITFSLHPDDCPFFFKNNPIQSFTSNKIFWLNFI